MHSVLKDEWTDADPGRGERVGVQYLEQRSGENYDHHMWTVKVDRPEGDSPNEGPKEPKSETGSSDRLPQKSSGGGAPDFEEDELYGKPALDSEMDEGEDIGGESTLDDPNGDSPF